MLNVTAQKSSKAAKAYFAKSDYLSESQEITGHWGGKGAVLLGLFGRVDKVAFDQLCDNINPQTFEPLTPITRGDRRAGYDFTWSASKSVSIVHALTGDERIVDAFRSSIRETMAELEGSMQARVRKGRQEYDRTTGNLLYSEFVHLTSRPVDGVPCPQLHAHLWCPNATFDPVEGQWKAGQFGKIKSDGYYWQAVQQVRFANRLQALGYAIRPTKHAFEIAGVPESAIAKFSLRTNQIERTAERLGITDPKAKAKLAATTREAKNNAIPYSELVQLWQQQLLPEEREALTLVRGSSTCRKLENVAHARYAAEHIFERASVIDEKRLLALALRHGVGEVTPEGVTAEVAKLALFKRESEGRVLVTTKEVLDEERRMLNFAVAGKGACRPLVPSNTAIHAASSGPVLSAEQEAAVMHLVSSPDRIMVLHGLAGAGKTTLTQVAVHRIEGAGKPVVMLAPSAQASRGVLRDEGFANADTLARFLIDEKMQLGAKDGVIWLDEAGLVGTKTMASLCDTASRLNARVVLVGDTRQNGSVERGAALRVLEDVAGLKIAEVTDIRRQSGDYKAAVKLLSMGKSIEGLDKLDAMGWVKLMPAVDSYRPIAKEFVEKFAASRDRAKGVLIVSPTHAEGQKVTDEVRSQLKASGLLGRSDREFLRLIPLQWTEAERGDLHQYMGDEILQFHRNSGDHKAGDRVRASAIMDGSLPLRAANFSAYAEGRIPLAKGDMIRITANGKTKDGAHKLNNGSVYSIRGFTKAGDIELANKWVISNTFGFLAPAYVSTAQAAQGRTVDHVLIVQSALSYPASSREGFYVAASRGRKSVKIFTDDKHELKQAVQRSQPRLSATELVKKGSVPLWRKMRERIAKIQLAALIATKAAVHEPPKREQELAYAR